jgi:hypothetical protein
MGQFIQVSGDYNIKAGEGATITLDTGAGVGNTRVTGNLIVEGDTLNVSVENLNIQDKIITLNFGETGNGVSLRYSGIEVDRGLAQDVSLLWDENDQTWNFKEGAGYNSSRVRLKEILTNADTDSGDLTLIGTGTGVVKVAGTTAYELQVTDPDDIPNKAYVDNAIQTNPTFQILRDDTRTAAFDINDPVNPALFPIGPYFVQPAASLVGIVVDNNIVAQFFRNRVQMAGANFFTEDPTPDNPLIPDATVIQTVNTNGNIKLETNGTGKVEITYALQLDNPGTTPAAVNNASLVYGGSVGPGSTGVYFRNTSKNDELISKSKALVFSMIF